MNLHVPAGRPIVVLGSLNMDLVLRVPQMPGPGQTLAAHGLLTLPGGKGANQAVACARMGAPVAIVGRVGTDTYGHALLGGLEDDGVDAQAVQSLPDASTGIAVVFVEDGGDNRIVLAPGANARLDAAAVRAHAPLIQSAALLLLQLEVPMEAVCQAAALASEAGVPVLLNAAPAAPLPEALWRAIDLLVLNEGEAEALSGLRAATPAEAMQAARALRSRGPRCVVVTLGPAGVVLVDSEGAHAQPATPVQAVDTTAAGDTYIGALAAGLVEGQPLQRASALGQAASALCVTRAGAQPSIPWRRELPPEFRRGRTEGAA